jgi:hypothetical protein
MVYNFTLFAPRKICFDDMLNDLRRLALAISLAVLSACSTTYSKSENPPANVNLSGYPLAFRQGYADGCASQGGKRQQDAERFAKDADYRQGWGDGQSICARR